MYNRYSIYKAINAGNLDIINNDKCLNLIKDILNDYYIISYPVFIKIFNTNKKLTDIILSHENAKINYFLDACYYGDFDMILVLINNGISINYNHDFALRSMMQNKKYDNASYLIQNDANVNELDDENKKYIFEYIRKVKLSKIIKE